MSTKDTVKGPVQVIDRMMKLLDVLAAHPEPLGLKQIAQYTALHPSTAHRILSALAGGRLVDRVEPGSYRLGMRLLELGNLVRAGISVRELALPVMRELHAHTGETVNLSVRHDDEIVYVERTSSGRSAMRVVHVIGARAALHITAAGKLFLLEDGFARLREYARRTGLAEHQQRVLGGVEHAARLSRAEGDALAEGIDGIDQPLGVQRGQPGDQGIDVVVRAAFVFQRHGMGGQVGRADGHPRVSTDAAGAAQQPCLVVRRQAVAGLDLDDGHAFGAQGQRALQRERVQFVIRSGSRGRHRRADAATGPRDGLVARALQAQLELLRPVAGVDEVGVAVDQARSDQRTAELMLLVGPQARRQRRLVAEPGNRVTVGQQRAALDQPPALGPGERRDARMAPQRPHGLNRPSSR